MRESRGRRREWKRGVIGEFSDPSRRRLLEKLATLKDEPAFWICLTYPVGEDVSQDGMPGKRDMATWEKRLRRRWGKEISVVWRCDDQKRGVVHWHCLVYGIDLEWLVALRYWCWAAWEGVIGVRGRVDVEKVECRRKVRWYMAYMGKKERDGHDGAPRADAGGAAADGAEGQDLSLVSYSTAGRRWGVYGRKFLPFAGVLKATVALSAAFYQVRRSARRKFRGVGGRRGRGFSLFTGDLMSWMRLIVVSQGEDCAWSSVGFE